MIEGKNPRECYFMKRGGTFCNAQSVVVFDASEPKGACMQHVGQVCLQAMGRGGLQFTPAWPVTAVPAQDWEDYQRREERP